MKRLFLALITLLVAHTSFGATAMNIHTERVDYNDGDTPLQGYLAYDQAQTGKRPGVIVVHEWTGEGAYVDRRARQLAELGYVAFAIDIYGKGVRPANQQEAGEQAGKYRKDVPLMRERAEAGLKVLQANPLVDTSRIAAMGYCFGGGVALEMARNGDPLAGVVSFHGSLHTPNPQDTKTVKCKILVLHGADDPTVPMVDIEAFTKEMNDAGADWQFVAYSHTRHGFTNPDNGTDNTKSVAYNKESDERSWQAMKDFFHEIFKP